MLWFLFHILNDLRTKSVSKLGCIGSVRDGFELFFFFSTLGELSEAWKWFFFLFRVDPFSTWQTLRFSSPQKPVWLCLPFFSCFALPASLSELSLFQPITGTYEIWAWWGLFLSRWKLVCFPKNNNVATVKTEIKVEGKEIQLWKDKNKGSKHDGNKAVFQERTDM